MLLQCKRAPPNESETVFIGYRGFLSNRCVLVCGFYVSIMSPAKEGGLGCAFIFLQAIVDFGYVMS